MNSFGKIFSDFSLGFINALISIVIFSFIIRKINYKNNTIKGKILLINVFQSMNYLVFLILLYNGLSL
jgi:hypothetical protein